MGTELATFDYGDLAAPDATALEKHAKRIDDIQVKTRRIAAEAVIAVGKELKAAHERLAGKGREGLFRPWVQRCGFSHTSAYKAVAAYDTFGGEKCKSSLHLFGCGMLMFAHIQGLNGQKPLPFVYEGDDYFMNTGRFLAANSSLI